MEDSDPSTKHLFELARIMILEFNCYQLFLVAKARLQLRLSVIYSIARIIVTNDYMKPMRPTVTLNQLSKEDQKFLYALVEKGGPEPGE